MASSTTTPERRWLVVLNPHGGGGRAAKFYTRHLKQELELHAVAHDMITTTSASHPFEIGASLDLAKYTGLASVSGDGMLHQLINGLDAHPDRTALSRVQLAIFPCGTGNGLASSLGVLKSVWKPLVEGMRDGKSTPVDTMEVVTECKGGAPRRRLATLSVTWGTIADHDMLTERKIRWMGPDLAMAVAPVVVLARRRVYEGTIAFEPLPGAPKPSNRASIAAKPSSSPSSSPPSLHQRISKRRDGLAAIRGPFHAVIIQSAPKIATDAVTAPRAHVGDGLIHVHVLHAPVSRVEYLKWLLSIEDGSAVAHPSASYFQTKKVILEPAEGRGEPVSLDGELIPAQRVEITMLPAEMAFAVAAAYEAKPLMDVIPGLVSDEGAASSSTAAPATATTDEASSST